jgi:hypothetical protein
MKKSNQRRTKERRNVEQTFDFKTKLVQFLLFILIYLQNSIGQNIEKLNCQKIT